MPKKEYTKNSMKHTLNPGIIRQAARFLKVVGHPVRLRLVERLQKGSTRVGDLVVVVRTSQAEVSKQLGVLRRAGIVRAEVRGNERWYAVADPRVGMILDCMRRHSKAGGKL